MKIVICTILLMSLTLVSCKRAEKTETDQGIAIHVTQVKNSGQDQKKEFPFIARPFRSSELSFRVGGPIDRFEVYAGNYYKCGEVIAEIDPLDFQIRKERTEAVYDQAKAEFERIKILYEKNNISASTYEKAKADYISAKTAFTTAVNELDDTRLIAPFNGYVGEVHIEKYQDVKATQPVISFVDIDQLKIETYVTQDIAFRAQEFKKAILRFDAMPEQVYEACVAEISKSTTPNKLSYLLTVLLPNTDGNLLAGMSGKLVLDLTSGMSSEPEVVLPQTAVCHRPTEGNYVWVVNTRDRKVSKRNVTPGELLPDGYIAIKQGLQPDETVAVSGLRFLSENMPVRISEQ